MVALAVLAAGACSKKTAAIAELTKAAGPVERQEGRAAWSAAEVGTRYFLGDAARTQQSTATLLIGGAAELAMRDHTIVRFGGGPGESKLVVELGQVELSGAGHYALDLGDVTLGRDGKVRIAAPTPGHTVVELTLGSGQVTAGGHTYELTLGNPVDLANPAPPRDAGVDAPPVDAAVEVTDATIEVTGKRGEFLAPGATTWAPLPPGIRALAAGTTVRLGPQTTARLTAKDTTLELAGGSRAKVTEALQLALELGSAQARAVAPASVALPGGDVALAGSDKATAELKLDSNTRETKVTVQRTEATLHGAPGAELAMHRGESAILTRSGAIRVLEANPTYFDFRVAAGETLTIHDPKPPTSVQLQFDGKCGSGGIIEVDRDGRFRTAKVSAGRDFANVLIPAGSWAYRLRCTTNGAEGAAVATGRIVVARDDGRRPLPKNQGVNDIDVDGRNYRISYQSSIPNVVVHVKGPSARYRLHLATGGKEQTFDAASQAITVPGAQLREGTYTYWVDRDGVKQEKVSTLSIDFDQTAPQVYIESPINGQAWTGDLDVRGAVLPGWAATVDAVAIPVDKQRRFTAKVGTPAGTALAIRLAHPQRGVHYYLRRAK